jgi:EmrB/QacA subfamily drug resistance transporter
MTKVLNKEALIYKRRWWTFLVLALAILIVVIDHTILNVALPTLQLSLGATTSQLQWIIDAYVLAFATLLLTMGTLGDRIGRAKMLRIGMTVFGFASLGAVFSDTAWQLIVARVGMGIGAAIIMPSTLAIITNIFPEDERGKAIGAWGAMNGIGVALGPLLGGILLSHFEWNSIFFINIPIVLTAIIAGFFLIHESRDPYPRKADIPGTLLSAAAISLLVFAFIKGSDWGWAHPLILCSFTGFLIAGFLFIRHEKKSQAPMLDLSLFKDSRLSSGSGSIAVMTIAMFGLLFAFTMYMQYVEGYSAMETGLRFLPMAFGYAIGSVSSNRIVKKSGRKKLVTAAFIGMAAASPFIALWQINTPYWQIGLLLFVISYCMGNIMTPSLNAVLAAAPKERAGVGSAIGNTSFQIGGALGIAALGSVLSSVYSSQMSSLSESLSSVSSGILEAAGESVGAAVGVASSLSQELQQILLSAAGESFMDGWQFVMYVVCGLGIAGAAMVCKFMPSGDIKK